MSYKILSTVLTLRLLCTVEGKSVSGITANAESLKDRRFDFIVAGGGLTGLTVASRLTEDPNISVLVVEAGNDDHENPLVNDVTTYGNSFGSNLDYSFSSEPIAAQQGARLPLISGKTLGGSGSINGASWTKGPRSQYDLIAELTGDASWKWDSFNKYMFKAEHFHPPAVRHTVKGAQFIADAHGYDGPVQVSFPEGLYSAAQVQALQAAQSVWPGLQKLPDGASGDVNGVTIIPNMVAPDAAQNRSSPFTAYAESQIQQRSNFRILTGHRVVEIIWDDNLSLDGPLRAKGVMVQSSRLSSPVFLPTKKEVIMAAGALQSPQILELSGVGDYSVLSAAGVPLRKYIPGVGKNLQEQAQTRVRYHVGPNFDFGGIGPSGAIAYPNVHQILSAGNLSSKDIHAKTLSSLPSYASHLRAENLVASYNGTLKVLQAQLANLFSLFPSIPPAAAEVFFASEPPLRQIGADIWNLIVLSRGTVHIATNSSWDQPRVNPRYFEHELDLKLQALGGMQAERVFEEDVLKSHWTEMVNASSIPHGQDAGLEEWKAWTKRTFESVWHFLGTAARMKEEDGGVVDERLKVYGVHNVRVVDASVVPVQLSAHLSSTLYGIGERAAEMIMQDVGAE